MNFIWPITGPISRDFYYLSSIYINGQHQAIDIPAPTGTPIKVVAAGEVRGVGWDIYSGFFVAVDHADNWTTRYRHLYGQSPVTRGQQVSQGQVIGTVGSTGWSTGPHLHFDLWNLIKQSPEAMYKAGWWAHDPELYLGQEEEDMALDPKADLTTFKKMLRSVLSNEEAIAIDDDENTVGSYHPLGLYLYRIRQLRARVRRLEQGSTDYTDERAVKAVKDKLSN